ncbi:hypothetical protein AB0O52_22990, partial [Arthrobacter sp. NPDC080073]
MNLTLNREMLAVLDALESDDRCAVVVLIVFGEAFSAGIASATSNWHEPMRRSRRTTTASPVLTVLRGASDGSRLEFRPAPTAQPWTTSHNASSSVGR